MKNKKNLILTTGIISLFVIAIVIGSGFFTGYLTSLKETENFLDADIDQSGSVDEIVFDYPYITINQLEENKDVPGYGFYKYEVQSINNQLLPMEIINVDETMITGQQAANTGGELVKYFYGYTYQQHAPSMIAPVKQGGLKQYCYALSDGSSPNPFGQNIRMSIDAQSGKVLAFVCPNPTRLTPDENIKDKFPDEITEEVKKKLEESIKTDLRLMGYKEEYNITDYEIDFSKGWMEYRVYFDIGQESRVIEYRTIDNNYFEIIRFALSKYDRNNKTVYRY